MHNLRRLLAANARRGAYSAEADTIMIYDVIVASDADAEWLGGVSAETVVRQIRSMSGPITLRINSPGGDVFAARAIQAAMEAHPDQITAYVDGYAASAASLIAVAADRCLMASSAFMMIHKAWTIAAGNADEMMASAALLEKIDASLAETYQAKGGQTPDHWSDLMRAETWFTAQEALDQGLADEVTAKPVKAAAQWDLSAYANAPAAPVAELEPVVAAPAVTPEETTDLEHRQRLHALRMRSPSA